MIIYLLLEDNFIITIPIGKENVDTVIQTVRMYRIDFNMPLDPILCIVLMFMGGLKGVNVLS